jgi:hypothetical protein
MVYDKTGMVIKFCDNVQYLYHSLLAGLQKMKQIRQGKSFQAFGCLWQVIIFPMASLRRNVDSRSDPVLPFLVWHESKFKVQLYLISILSYLNFVSKQVQITDFETLMLDSQSPQDNLQPGDYKQAFRVFSSFVFFQLPLCICQTGQAPFRVRGVRFKLDWSSSILNVQFSPCRNARKASLDCIIECKYDSKLFRERCTAFFEAYRTCKITWVCSICRV